MTEKTDEHVAHSPQSPQAWTAPSLIRLDTRGAEGNLGIGPDFLAEAS